MDREHLSQLEEARRLVALALALVAEAGDTLAAAELEQALDTVTRHVDALRLNSGSSAAPSSGLQ